METKIFNAIKKLSQYAEKEQRDYNFKTNHNYTRPGIAGAYYYGNKTMITNGAWGVIFDGIVEGLQMAQDKSNKFNLDNIINDNLLIYCRSELNLDLARLKDLKSQSYTEIIYNKSFYNIDFVIKVANCFKNCKIYNDPNNKISQLLFVGDNGIGILCPIRKN